MVLPDFPPPFVVERVQQLGYGSGPWRREDLVARWNGPTADKLIRDAKSAGWLVSPRRGLYFVPGAQDLMTVNWLPPRIRMEFLISRTLSSADIRYWCLSRHCRENGVDLGGPLFVTDLGRWGEKTDQILPASKDLVGVVKQRGRMRQTLPWLESLIIVPYMPQVSEESAVSWFELPEPPHVKNQRQVMEKGATAVAGLIALLGTALGKNIDLDDLDLSDINRQATSIPYSVGPRLQTLPWVIALLAALGLSRASELATDLANRLLPDDRKSVQGYARLIGPPQPNNDWYEAIDQGPFPFLLVPQVLWDQMGADQAARRARTLEKLVGGAGA